MADSDSTQTWRCCNIDRPNSCRHLGLDRLFQRRRRLFRDRRARNRECGMHQRSGTVRKGQASPTDEEAVDVSAQPCVGAKSQTAISCGSRSQPISTIRTQPNHKSSMPSRATALSLSAARFCRFAATIDERIAKCTSHSPKTLAESQNSKPRVRRVGTCQR